MMTLIIGEEKVAKYVTRIIECNPQTFSSDIKLKYVSRTKKLKIEDYDVVDEK